MKSLHVSIVALTFLLWGHTMIRAAETLTDKDIKAGRQPQVGDTVVLDDFANCAPSSAIGQESVKGKWWLRDYRTADGRTGTMLCVEERDRDNPASCIAPELTYDVNLEGVYDIWVGTYRDVGMAGIDIKLSNDRVYMPINPCDDGVTAWPPPADQVGRLAECFYKTADLTGQDIHLRQPHGTYGTLWWGWCKAHVAYLKLVRRDPESVKQEAARRAKLDRKQVMNDRDGFSYVWQNGEENEDCILQQVEELRHGGCDVLNWCIGGSLTTNFPHPMSAGRAGEGGGRLGDARYVRVSKYFEANKIDVLKVLTDRCHEVGIKIFVSQRANNDYGFFGARPEHKDWWGDHGLNYGNPQLQAFLQDFLLYIPEHYDVDGLTIDFTRHPPFFNDAQNSQEFRFERMTNYLRGLRSGLDKIGQRKGKYLPLHVSFEANNWRGHTAEKSGLDVATWVDKGIVNCIMPEGREVSKYIEMCKGKKAQCWPRHGAGLHFDGTIIDVQHTFDPTPVDDKHDRFLEVDYAPLQILAGARDWYQAGADGIFLFNQDAYTTPLRNIGYPELIREEIATGQPFGRRVGEKIEWLEAQ